MGICFQTPEDHTHLGTDLCGSKLLAPWRVISSTLQSLNWRACSASGKRAPLQTVHRACPYSPSKRSWLTFQRHGHLHFSLISFLELFALRAICTDQGHFEECSQAKRRISQVPARHPPFSSLLSLWKQQFFLCNKARKCSARPAR